MLSQRAEELANRRIPYVHALVVRAQMPSSARPGNEAIVLADGSIEGFVGGQCAVGAVRVAALEALRGGQPRLLRVLPDDSETFPDAPGADVVVNPCLSGGALEIFIEPVLPPPLVQVLGDSPVAQAVSGLTGFLDYALSPAAEGKIDPQASAVVIASHGRGEHATIQAALDSGVGYIALVASPRRGRTVLDELGLDAAQRQRISTPAGLDIGAQTAPEIAVSIMAELITALKSARTLVPEPLPEPGAGSGPESGPEPGPEPGPESGPVPVTDPVCGMSVLPGPDAPHLQVGSAVIWFCGPGCREHYAAGLDR